MALTQIEKTLLEKVIGVTGDDETRIRDGIIVALRNEHMPGRRNYLWHLLEKEAKRKIHAARQKHHVPA